MKKQLPPKPTAAIPSDEMRPKYDFTGGVRGKHYKVRLTGYTIKITQREGATHVKQVERLELKQQYVSIQNRRFVKAKPLR